MVHGKKILLAPLDWGLGHATRCIPLITQLLENDCMVVVAGTEKTNAIIREAFPDLRYEELEGYHVRYGHNPRLMPLWILLQLPKFFLKIRKEKNWLKIKVETLKPDLILSDNRYGFRHASIPSIFITHQVNIQVPGSAFLETLVNRVNHSFIRKFNECWIPDKADFHLAGSLSYSSKHLHTKYIGWLSRFKKPLMDVEPNIDFLFLLSGPEPQRTILEEKIIREGKILRGKKVLVRGKPDQSSELVLEGFEVHNHLKTEALEEILLTSRNVICRSGYSTLMDLVRLKKRALFIPTPGQTEQEYLAQYLMEKKLFVFIPQHQPIQKGLDLMNSSFLEALPEE